MRAVRRRLLWLGVPLVVALTACGSGDSTTAPPPPPPTPSLTCGSPPYFTTLPVSIGDVDMIAAFGGLGAPGHTLPTAHTGFLLGKEGAAVSSPGAMRVTELRRGRYLVSPNRQGVSDYAVNFEVCKDVTGWFGHLVTLVAPLANPPGGWTNCSTYSTALETVESCTAAVSVTLTAGQPMGTGGASIALGLMGLDFGLLDSRVNNFYVAAWRHPIPSFRAICPWDQFTPLLSTQLYAKLRDPGRNIVPSGEPRCGTMSVDVAGTAKGVWAEPSETQPVAGNETRYMTLANYPYRPQEFLALSLGPVSIGAKVAVVPRQTTGRVNRAFEQVTDDGLIYCYGTDQFYPTESWLLRVTGASGITIRMVTHAAGASPCLADPATWSVAGGLSMVR